MSQPTKRPQFPLDKLIFNTFGNHVVNKRNICISLHQKYFLRNHLTASRFFKVHVLFGLSSRRILPYASCSPHEKLSVSHDKHNSDSTSRILAAKNWTNALEKISSFMNNEEAVPLCHTQRSYLRRSEKGQQLWHYSAKTHLRNKQITFPVKLFFLLMSLL